MVLECHERRGNDCFGTRERGASGIRASINFLGLVLFERDPALYYENRTGTPEPPRKHDEECGKGSHVAHITDVQTTTATATITKTCAVSY